MNTTIPPIKPRFTFDKRQPCKSRNIPIAHFRDQDDKKKVVYYIDGCKCAGSEAHAFSTIDSPPGHLITPIPFFIKDQRIGPICIASMSGGGKSTYCNRLAHEITELNKHNDDLQLKNVYLITAANQSDPAYDTERYGPIRVDLPHAMKNAVMEDFRQSLVIFDDYQNHADSDIEDWVKLLAAQLLERSRKLQAHLIFCNHRQRNGHATTLLNIESQAFVLFYNSNRNESAKLLKDYLDFSKKDVAKLFAIDNGRFSTAYINRNPRYIITNQRIYAY